MRFKNGLGVFMFLIIMSCKNTTKEPVFSFYYYPDQNLYYNVSNSNYLYSLNGGKSWDSTRLNAGSEPAIVGKKVLLTGNSPDIWKENASHRQTYNGVLLDFETEQISGDELADVSEKKIVLPKRKEVEQIEITRPRKDNFFNKLFRKKKKTEKKL